jgi:hypothetical protein
MSFLALATIALSHPHRKKLAKVRGEKSDRTFLKIGGDTVPIFC